MYGPIGLFDFISHERLDRLSFFSFAVMNAVLMTTVLFCCFVILLLYWTHACVRSYEFIAVRSYVRTSGFFSELSHRNYLIFCMKLAIHGNSKLTEPDFPGEIWFSQNFEKVSKIGQKSGFSTFFQNLVHRCM